MFAILYQASDRDVEMSINDEGVIIRGKWVVDTEDDGSVAMIDDLEIALSRVKDIRQKGGEACLVTIIE